MTKTISTCAIIVTYFPIKNDLNELINTVDHQVDKIYVIDNTDDFSAVNDIQHLIVNKSKAHYISIGYNSGIGTAQNIGLELAFKDSFDAALILDQDSVLPENLVSRLVSGIHYLYEQNQQVACIGPTVFNRDTNNEYKALFDKGHYLNNDFKEVTSLISSGSIILREAYEIVGGMDEELFIDNVDFEWCWRANSKGYKSFVAKNVTMGHRVGARDISILNIFSLQVPSPSRHYYQFRNTIILMRRNYTPLYFKIRSVVIKPIEIIVYSLFVKPRKDRMKMIFKGILHGIINKKGEM